MTSTGPFLRISSRLWPTVSRSMPETIGESRIPGPVAVVIAPDGATMLIGTGSSAAALTGLVFVAMSLHLDQIALNVAHRHRARTVLTGLTAVFIRCALVLMAGQSAQAIALELILVLVGVEIILFLSIRQAMRASEAADPALLWRTIGSFACLVTEQLGAVVLFTGDARGLYAVGVGMMASFVFMVSGAWLLIVGVRREEAAEAIV